MIPVVKFLRKEGIVSKTEQTVDHQRGATGLYDARDMVILSVVGIVGGARSIRAIVTVWNDRVLSRVAGWLRIPDETTFGRILRTFTQKNINEMESLNHRIRTGIWRKALRSGTSIVGVLHCLVIDVDSTVKTAYGKQQGVSVGYNPHKRPLRIILCWHFAQRQRRFFRVGFVMGVPIPELRVPERTLYNAQWYAWVAVGETWILCFTPVETFFRDVDPQIQREVSLESCARESGYQIITKYDDLMEGGKT